MKYIFVTFGTDHKHTLAGIPYGYDLYAAIPCHSESEGRKKAMAVFGRQFCTTYYGPDAVTAGLPNAVSQSMVVVPTEVLERDKAKECYSCVHRQHVEGSRHLRCLNPDITMTGEEVGKGGGWFNYPLDFDPLWKTKLCANYKEAIPSPYDPISSGAVQPNTPMVTAEPFKSLIETARTVADDLNATRGQLRFALQSIIAEHDFLTHRKEDTDVPK